MCRNEDFTTFPNKQNERAVKNLHVFCTNKGRGCDWKGEVNDITDHLSHNDGCLFERVNCSNKCGVSLERRCLSKHIDAECPYSKITCRYCYITGGRHFITGQHQEQCSKFPLPCPNNCDIGMVFRENMEAHKAECSLEMIQCDYHEVGCKDIIARKDKMKHDKEKMENHLCLMKCSYLHTTSKLADAEKKIKELQQKTELIEDMMFKHVFQWHTILTERVNSKHKAMPITFRMSEYCKRKEDYSEFCSSCFEWQHLPLLQVYPRIKLQVTPAGCDDGKGTHLSVQLWLVKGGRKRDYAHELHLLDEEYKNKGKPYDIWYRTDLRSRERQIRLQHEILQQRKALERQRLQEIQKWNVICKTQHLCVTILNQICDSEHYSVCTNQIDLETDNFLKNEDCRVLIFDSPHFISNEILGTSTAACRYLQHNNVYFSIKVQ